MVDFTMKNKEWNKCTYLVKVLKQRNKRLYVYLMAFLYKEIEKFEKNGSWRHTHTSAATILVFASRLSYVIAVIKESLTHACLIVFSS